MAILKRKRGISDDTGAPAAATEGPARSTLHSELCGRAARWLRRSCGCSAVLSELVSFASETPDAIGWRSGYSILVEVKTSRSDFLADRKKWHRKKEGMGMGVFRFFLCPEGLITPADLPAKWGLLYTTARGVKKVVAPRGNVWGHQHGFIHQRNQDAEITLLVSALRRQQQSGEEGEA